MYILCVSVFVYQNKSLTVSQTNKESFEHGNSILQGWLDGKSRQIVETGDDLDYHLKQYTRIIQTYTCTWD